MLATLVYAGLSLQANAASHGWLYEPWDSAKDKGMYRDFRLQCEDLVWGLKKPVDVLDKKTIDALYKKTLQDFKSAKTEDTTFRIVCLMAYFGDQHGAGMAVQLPALLWSTSGFRSYEFTRVAYVAQVLLRYPPLPKTDIEARLMSRRKDDPLLMTAMIQSADFLMGLRPEHKRAVEYAEKLYAMFPARREKYRAVLVVALYQYWTRSKDQPSYDRAMKLIAESLADEQTSEEVRKSMTNLKRQMEFVKKKDGGG